MGKAILIMLFFTSCAKIAERQADSTKPDFDVEKLFTSEGCAVYRFYDAGHFRYFANCNGSVNHTQQCGKNCTRTETIPTNKSP
jgi:hypothetical protein